MRFQLNERVLTLYFEGELNSYNADNMEKEMEIVVALFVKLLAELVPLIHLLLITKIIIFLNYY